MTFNKGNLWILNYTEETLTRAGHIPRKAGRYVREEIGYWEKSSYLVVYLRHRQHTNVCILR